jgi:hypothetical protein
VDPAPAAPVVGGRAEYVCLPRGMFPFRVNDEVQIMRGATESDPFRIVQQDADGLPVTELVIASIAESSFIGGVDLRVSPRSTCGYVLSEACAQTTTPADVRVEVGSEEQVVRSGAEPQTFALRDRELTIAVPLAQDRVLVDTGCAAGPDAAGIDATVVIVIRWGGA